jgi:hypothetical protein
MVGREKELRLILKGLILVPLSVSCPIATGASYRVLSPGSEMAVGNPQAPKPKPSLPEKLNEEQREQQWREYSSGFPRTNYDALEPDDPSERAKRSARSKRHDGQNLVGAHPTDTGKASILLNHWDLDLPSLPVSESCAILVTDVVKAEAYLSLDKRAVYSEFTLRVAEILKSDGSGTSAGDLINADRLGGVVHYQWGHDELYAVAKQNMPRVGKRYAFFLKCTSEPREYEIVTAYELTSSGVLPLDDPDQFQSYQGEDSVRFLRKLRELIQPPSKPQPIEEPA